MKTKTQDTQDNNHASILACCAMCVNGNIYIYIDYSKPCLVVCTRHTTLPGTIA